MKPHVYCKRGVGGCPKAISGAISLPVGVLYYFVLCHFTLFNIVFPKIQGFLVAFFFFFGMRVVLIGSKAV